MKLIFPGNRMTPALLAICGLLGVIVAFEWHSFSQKDDISSGSATRPVVASDLQPPQATYVAPGFDAYSEILERPLFTEGRTPPPPPAAKKTSASPAKQTRLTLRLEGVALTPGARVAVVRDITSNKLFRLSEGEKHQGWVVESVNPAGATFRRGEQTRELLLELNRKSPGTIPGQLNRRKK